MNRIAVVGTSGSGKTTLAQALGQRLEMPVIELDSIHWGPNWTPIPSDQLRQELVLRLNSPRWVVDGNYSRVRDLVWTQADTLIWLDYTLPAVLWSLARRTFGRIARRQVLWNGNRENLKEALFKSDSLFLWALKTHGLHRRDIPAALGQPEYCHLKLYHFKSIPETNRWLAKL